MQPTDIREALDVLGAERIGHGSPLEARTGPTRKPHVFATLFL